MCYSMCRLAFYAQPQPDSPPCQPRTVRLASPYSPTHARPGQPTHAYQQPTPIPHKLDQITPNLTHFPYPSAMAGFAGTAAPSVTSRLPEAGPAYIWQLFRI